MRAFHKLIFLLFLFTATTATSCSLASDFSDYQFEKKDDTSDSGKDEPSDAEDASVKPKPDAGRDAGRDAERDAGRDAGRDVSTPCVPSGPDVCDGEDNDCDPETEDGSNDPIIGQPCDGEDADRCEDGQNVCRDGRLVCDDDRETVAEVCDGEDNDCNPDTPDGVDEASYATACDGDDDDLCEEGEYLCENGELICSDDSDSNRDICDGADNDCNPDTPDGIDEPELDQACDSDEDPDLCEDDTVACVDGALICSDRGDARDEICGNSEDEDCDGAAQPCIALPTLNAEFPGPTGASSAADLTFDFENPDASNSWTALCRTAAPGAIDDALPWTDCPSGSNLPVKPFTPAQSEASTLNGLRETQIRFQWNNGDVSDTFSRVHYVHNSLHGVSLCPKVSEELMRNYFDKAATLLVRTGTPGTPTFDLDNDLQLRSPFIQIRFAPPIDSTFSVRDGDGEIEPLSLRRRFVFETNDKQLLLMFRVYQSRRGFGCTAMRTHKYVGGSYATGEINYHYRDNRCDAVVLNKQGAGVCLRRNSDDSADIIADTEGHGQVFVYAQPQVDFSTYYCIDYGSSGPSYTDVCADNFMWREFVRKRGSTGYLEHFSPKCFSSPSCADSEEIYLPDRERFPDIFP